MSEIWMRDVMNQHRRLCPDQVGTTPARIDGDLLEMRLRLIHEEYTELRDALVAGNLPDAVDGMGDLIVVVLGTAVAMGVDVAPVWDAIHEANMAKTPRPVGTYQKWGKPPGWKPPDVEEILRRQRPLGEVYPEVAR